MQKALKSQRIATTQPIKSLYQLVEMLTLKGYWILLMEEILHHLGCIKPCKYIIGKTIYYLVQDFFHQQYQWTLGGVPHLRFESSSIMGRCIKELPFFWLTVTSHFQKQLDTLPETYNKKAGPTRRSSFKHFQALLLLEALRHISRPTNYLLDMFFFRCPVAATSVYFTPTSFKGIPRFTILPQVDYLVGGFNPFEKY